MTASLNAYSAYAKICWLKGHDQALEEPRLYARKRGFISASAAGASRRSAPSRADPVRRVVPRTRNDANLDPYFFALIQTNLSKEIRDEYS